MPELPEVEVIRRGLVPYLIGRKVVRIVCANRKLRLPIPRAAFARWIKEGTIQTLDRRAKYLLMGMENGATVVIHLGMTGRLGLFPVQAKRARHDHMRIQLDNGMELRFNDTRRFGSVQVVAPGDLQKTDPFTRLGREPLGSDFTSFYLFEKAQTRRKPIKNFLMDSRVVVGIGNIYANEILFQAGIAPTTPALNLHREAWERIVQSCRNVLQQAIAGGGTTIADFVNHNGQTGYFQLQLQVYGRQGQPCYRCGKPICRIVLAGRATYFCKYCQS